MKYVVALFFVFILVTPMASAQEATLAWFTDAITTTQSFPKVTKPTNAQPDVTGSYKNGVLLTHAVGFTASTLKQQHGMINFWIKPNWNGNDNQRHIFLKVGDPSSNGILIEKSEKNMLRFVMAGGNPAKVTVSRYDVSNWEAGKWHHIACTWMDMNNKPAGLALWIDHVCVDSIIYGGTSFMNPSTMTDKNIYVGDESSDAVMDELIVRNNVTGTNGPSQIDMVHRDYFRTGPYTAIKINPEPNYVRSETRVVKGYKKQFGLLALRQEGYWESITDYSEGYVQLGCFDAKPFITWYSNKTSIATVDNSASSYFRGLVTGVDIGQCNLTATFRSMTATYPIEVITHEQPDLDILFVERYPRYSKYYDNKKWVYDPENPKLEVDSDGRTWPEEGETITSVVHYANFGFKPSAACKMKFEIVSDDNENFVLDDTDTVILTSEADIEPLTVKAMGTKAFTWTWPRVSQGEHQVFVRVTIDTPDDTHPRGYVNELCEANNQRAELNIARAAHWGYHTEDFEAFYNNKTMNLVGSFSPYDWTASQIDRMNLILRQSVYPSTSPVGVQDALRIDNYYTLIYPGGFFELRGDEPWKIDEKYYDGGWCWVAGDYEGMKPMQQLGGILHEFGHYAGFNEPDVYNDTHDTYGFLLKDPNGNRYSDTVLYPSLDSDRSGIFSKPFMGNSDMLGIGLRPLMTFCSMWMDSYTAGLAQYYKQDRIYATHYNTRIPTSNRLQVLDLNDEPLENAAVYVYQIANAYLYGKRFVPDRAKFMGNTDSNGYWVFPTTADPTWDDPSTEEVDGAIPGGYHCGHNPFIQPGFSSDYGVEGCLFIIKIVSDNQTEFKILNQREFVDAYLSGQTQTATYTMRTSLRPGGAEVIPPIIPDVIKSANKQPIVEASDIYVLPGKTYTLDASYSYDPEGQPLTYFWFEDINDWRIFPPIFVNSPTLTRTAPSTLGDYYYRVYVVDGLRASYSTRITVHVVPPDSTPPRMESVTASLIDENTLYAYWYGYDYDSGVAEYKYAIGTSPTDPGSGYFVDWTSTGTKSDIKITGLNLVEGQTYYFYVKCRNVSNLWSNVVVSNAVVMPIPLTIAETKCLPVDIQVILKDVVCSGYIDFSNFYVQSLDRSAGIKVYHGDHNINQGAILDLVGWLRTSIDGEPYIYTTSVKIKGTTTVTPLGLTNRAIGGAKTGLQEGTSSWKWAQKEDGTSEYKLLPDLGINNVGLLVKTTGKVTYIDPRGEFAYIDDGSQVDDGNKLGPNGTSIKGIRIWLLYGQYKMPAVGSHVSITGFPCTRNDNGYKAMIQMRSLHDIASIDGSIISGRVTTTTITDYLVETPHPTQCYYYNTWEVSGPTEALQMRPHFTRIENNDSYMFYRPINGNTGPIYPSNTNVPIWGDWIPGNKMSISYYDYGGLQPYGFKMDMYESIIPLAGVTMTLMPGNITTITDENGYFFFENLRPGTYTVTPSLGGTTFSPSYQEITAEQGKIYYLIDFITN